MMKLRVGMSFLLAPIVVACVASVGWAQNTTTPQIKDSSQTHREIDEDLCCRHGGHFVVHPTEDGPTEDGCTEEAARTKARAAYAAKNCVGTKKPDCDGNPCDNPAHICQLTVVTISTSKETVIEATNGSCGGKGFLATDSGSWLCVCRCKLKAKTEYIPD